MPSARRGGSASSRKRSFVFSTTDVHFWTTRSASNINQIGQFHQHFPGTKATPPSPVYQPNPSTSSNVASEDAHFRTYESEPRRRVSGYGTLSSNGASRRVETTETTDIPTTTIMEDRRIQKEFYRNRSRPDVANSSLRATTNGSAATYHSVAVHSTSNGVLAVSGFQGNETDENIEAWMREQPIALRRLDRHDRLVLKIGVKLDRSIEYFKTQHFKLALNVSQEFLLAVVSVAPSYRPPLISSVSGGCDKVSARRRRANPED
ncbi:hypothetical protein QR680_009717 [Steinernema hermaphroditum]|uniref:Uncharacterized protein n=1 Tax=Steinernema hermaphroditum TaxID=289476 RepID=A0AA39MA97_9BILA|nr:hypothetical protein QR680_009717 [Steinernema hermaphroditum]